MAYDQDSALLTAPLANRPAASWLVNPLPPSTPSPPALQAFFMNFRSEITIRMPDGVFLPPFVLLHHDTEIFSAVTFLRAMGNQIAWHQNGNLYGLQILIDPIPEHASGGKALPMAEMNRPTGPLDPVSVPMPTNHDFDDVFSCLGSPANCPNGIQKQ